MKIGQVMGSIWCTRKEESLNGLKLMQVRVLEDTGGFEASGAPSSAQSTAPKRSTVVAVDMIGAGIGEKVLLVSGSSARKHANLLDAPIDMLIVGIIDPDNGIQV